MVKDSAVVGIDLGGTNLRLALVSPRGEILRRWEQPTATMPDREAMIATLVRELGTDLELILDVGPCPGGLASSIVDVTVAPPRLVRAGAIPAARLREVIPDMRF